jgi:multidrug efflux pump subunit AcrA (membrane-fusion protein)
LSISFFLHQASLFATQAGRPNFQDQVEKELGMSHQEPASVEQQIGKMLCRYLGLGMFLLCTLFGSVSCGRAGQAPETPTVAISEPTAPNDRQAQDNAVETLEFEARVVPAEEATLRFTVAGRVKQVHVKPGERVKAGDTLAELEVDELQNQIAQAKVAVRSAQLALSHAEKTNQLEIAASELNLTVAQTRLEQAEEEHALLVLQAKKSLALAQEQPESDENAAAALGQAQSVLKELEEGVNPLFTLEVQRAQHELAWLKESVDPVLANEIERAQLVVDRLNLQLRASKLQAPFDGTVAHVWIRPGDVTAYRTEAVLIADLDRFDLEIDLSQFDIAHVHVGQQARFILDAFPDTVMTGQVTQVALKETEPKGDQVLYTARVSVETPDTVVMRWGMTGIAQIDAPAK